MVCDGRYLAAKDKTFYWCDIDNLDSPSDLNPIMWSVDKKSRLMNRSTTLQVECTFKKGIVSITKGVDLYEGDPGILRFETQEMARNQHWGEKLQFNRQSLCSELVFLYPGNAESYLNQLLVHNYINSNEDIGRLKKQRMLLENNLRYKMGKIMDKYRITSGNNHQVNTLRKEPGMSKDVLNEAKKAIDYTKKGAVISYEYNHVGLVNETLEEDILTYEDGYYCTKYTNRGVNCAFELSGWRPQNYSYASAICLHKPQTDYIIKIGAEKWIIEITNQVQVDCPFDENGSPRLPTEPANATKLGTYSSSYKILGKKIPCTVTVTRQIYQTPRSNKISGKVGKTPFAYGVPGNLADPFAPWRIKETSRYEIDLDVINGVLGYGNALLAYRIIENECKDFGAGKVAQTAIVAALYQTYLSGANQIDMSAGADKYEMAGDYVKAFSEFYLNDNIDGCERVATKAFQKCKDADELLDTYIQILKNFPNADKPYAYFFAGLDRLGKEPLHKKDIINSLHPKGTFIFFDFWVKRDQFFSHDHFLGQKSSEILKEYLSTGLALPIDINYCSELAVTANPQWKNYFKPYLDIILQIELTDIKIQLDGAIEKERLNKLKTRLNDLKAVNKSVGILPERDLLMVEGKIAHLTQACAE